MPDLALTAESVSASPSGYPLIVVRHILWVSLGRPGRCYFAGARAPLGEIDSVAERD